MASFVDKLNGSSERWLRQFWTDLDKTRKRRELEIEKARLAGLKDQANRLIALNKFWIAHPELEALSLLREQNPEEFDSKHPEHANIKDIADSANYVFTKGNAIETSRFMTNIADPATTRVRTIQDLKTNPENGPNAFERFKNSIPGGSGSAKELMDYAKNKQAYDINFKNAKTSALAKDAAGVKYKYELEKNPQFLDAMNKPDYLENRGAVDAELERNAQWMKAVTKAENTYFSQGKQYPQLFNDIKKGPDYYFGNKEAIDHKMATRGSIIKRLQDFDSYYDKTYPDANKVVPYYEKLKNKLALSWDAPAVLEDPEVNDAAKRLGDVALLTQKASSIKIKNFLRDHPEMIESAFNNVVTRAGYSGADAKHMWNNVYGQHILNNIGNEVTDMRTVKELNRAISYATSSPDANESKIIEGLVPHLYNTVSNYTDILKKPPGGGENTPVPAQTVSGGEPPASPGTINPNDVNYNDLKSQIEQQLQKGDEEEEGSEKDVGPFSEQPDQTSQAGQPPIEPDPVLDTLALYGILVWPTGVYQKKVGAMPGDDSPAEKISDEMLPLALTQFYATRGTPELTDYALHAINNVSMGMTPQELFAKIPTSYSKFIKSVKKFKDDPDKLKEVYAQFGSDSAQAEKIGGSIAKSLSQNTPLSQVYQNLNKEFQIPIPKPPAPPQTPGAKIDPVMQEKVKQEQLKTQQLEKEMQIKDQERAQDTKNQEKEDEMKEKETEQKVAMDERKLQMEQQKMQIDQQATAADVQLSAQKAQDDKQMKVQQYTDQKQERAAQMEQQKQEAAAQAQLQQQQQQQQQAQSGIDPRQQAIDEYHYKLQSAPGNEGIHIHGTEWDQQSGQHVTRVRSRDGKDYVVPVNQGTIQQYGVPEQHAKMLMTQPQQQAAPAQQQPARKKTTILPPGAGPQPVARPPAKKQE